MDKALDVVGKASAEKKVSDIFVHGDPYRWVCICKASSNEQGWMKSTKVMETPQGCLVQVTSQQRNSYDGVWAMAEALSFIPGAKLTDFAPYPAA